jgi:enoyl-CoA hydratase/carnithine racemase
LDSKSFAPFPIKTRAGAANGGSIAVVHIGGDEPTVVDARFARRFEATLHALLREASIGGAILCSESQSHFAEGPKLAQLRDVETEADADAFIEPGARLLLRMHAMEKPIVAVLDGVATGAGFELALACSGIVATPRAACSLANNLVGYLPGHHGLQALASRVGPAEAARIALGGEVLSGARLVSLGLAESGSDPFVEAERLIDRGPRGVPRMRGHHVVTGRAALSLYRKRALACAALHDVARERVFELLQVFISAGFTASVALERHLAAELAISHTTKRLIKRALSPKTQALGGDFSARLQCAFVGEALALIAEGVTAREIDAALVRWGFLRGPLALGDHIGRARVAEWRDRFRRTLGDRFALPVAKPRMRPASAEEQQARCVMRLVNEAQHCLAEGLVSDPVTADFTAAVATGFPAFRGGPFAYADDLGHEFGERLRVLERRFGARFADARPPKIASIDAVKP